MEQFSIEKNTWSEISGHFTYQANSEFYLPRIFTGFRRSLAQLSPSKTFFLHGILIFNFTKLFDITSDFCFVFCFSSYHVQTLYFVPFLRWRIYIFSRTYLFLAKEPIVYLSLSYFSLTPFRTKFIINCCQNTIISFRNFPHRFAN